MKTIISNTTVVQHWAMGWMGVQVLAGVGNFSLHHHVQTRSGAHTASHTMGNRGSFPGGKVAGA